MHSYQEGVIFSLNGKRLKSVDQFIYVGSNILSTEIDVNKCIGKTWVAIDKLLTRWKSDPFR